MSHFLDVVGRFASRIALALVIAIILLPVAMTVLMSFSNQPSFAFPPAEFGFRQYIELFTNSVWVKAITLSFSLALPAALIAVLVALPVCLVAQRSSLPGRNLLQGAAIGSLLVPTVSLGVGLFAVFSRMGLTSSNFGLVIGQAVLATPLVVITISASLSRIPRTTEFAAMVMGASRLRSLVEIAGRALVPAIIASFVMGLLLAFDEVVIVNFVGGPGQVTLPKAIFDSVLFSIDPVITAAATLLMLFAGSLMAIAALVGRRTSRRKERM